MTTSKPPSAADDGQRALGSVRTVIVLLWRGGRLRGGGGRLWGGWATEQLEQAGQPTGPVEQRQCRRRVAVEMGQHLQPEVERDDAVRDLLGRRQLGQRGAGHRPADGIGGEGPPRRDAGRHLGAEAGGRRRPGHHLREDGDVAGPEILLEYGPGGIDQPGESRRRGHRLLVLGEPSRADVVQRGEQQVGDRTEVVEDEPLVAPRPLGDLAGAGPAEPVLPQGVDRRGDERSLGLLRAGALRAPDRTGRTGAGHLDLHRVDRQIEQLLK